MGCDWQGSDVLVDIQLGCWEFKLLKLPFWLVNLILSRHLELQSWLYLGYLVDSMDNLAHKMLHTFEKMDPINPTFEPVIICNKLLVEFDLRQNFGYLFGLFPFVTQVNTHLNEIANDVCLGRWILFAVGLMRFTFYKYSCVTYVY